MPRKANAIRFTTQSNEPAGCYNWPVPDLVYPKVLTFHVEHTAAPDPFSSDTEGRTVSHTLIHFANFATVDCGWVLDAEEVPARPLHGADLYPGLVTMFAENWDVTGPTRRANGEPSNWDAWDALRGMLRVTVMGAVYQFAEQQRWPRWSRYVRLASTAGRWVFDGGIPVAFGHGSPDLRYVFDAPK